MLQLVLARRVVQVGTVRSLAENEMWVYFEVNRYLRRLVFTVSAALMRWVRQLFDTSGLRNLAWISHVEFKLKGLSFPFRNSKASPLGHLWRILFKLSEAFGYVPDKFLRSETEILLLEGNPHFSPTDCLVQTVLRRVLTLSWTVPNATTVKH